MSTDEHSLRVGNYLALWGGRDLEGVLTGRVNADGSRGEFFTPFTDFSSPYTATGVLYVDWEHGAGKAEGGPGPDEPLGYVDWSTARLDSTGLWVERVLNRRSRYVARLEQLIDAGLIGTSSEAISTGVVKAADGEIRRWPLIRDTLTVNPVEPRMLGDNVLAAVKALSLDWPALKILIPSAPVEETAQPEAASTAAAPVDAGGGSTDAETPSEPEDLPRTAPPSDALLDVQPVREAPSDAEAVTADDRVRRLRQAILELEINHLRREP